MARSRAAVPRGLRTRPDEPMTVRRVSLGGIPVDIDSRHGFIARLAESATDEPAVPRMAFDLYADCLNQAFGNPEYRSALQASDMNYPDGMGVVTALRAIGVPSSSVEKATTTDLIHPLCEEFAE